MNYRQEWHSWSVVSSLRLTSTLDHFQQTLHSHSTPITALDLSEPYGTLVSASQEDAQPRVWDLFSGSEVGRLRGHRGTVKCLQVEDHVCLTGGEDGNVRLWDLRKVEEEEEWERTEEIVGLNDVPEEDAARGENDGAEEPSDGIRSSKENAAERDGPCARVLEGHSKAVTAIYFEDDCLVSTLHLLRNCRTDPPFYSRSLELPIRPFDNGISPPANA